MFSYLPLTAAENSDRARRNEFEILLCILNSGWINQIVMTLLYDLKRHIYIKK